MAMSDIGSPQRYSRYSDNESPPDSPHPSPSGLLEPFIIDNAQLEASDSMLWNRLRSYTPSWMRRRRTIRLLGPRARARISYKIPGIWSVIFYTFICYLSFLGLIHLLGDILDVLDANYPDDLDWILHHWGRAGEETESWAHWPTDATGGINPVSCHSHNDYWQPVPLYSAIYAGCTGAEADIFLIDDELYVGHTRYALSSNRTLENLYINPLLDLLERQNPTVTFQPHKDYPAFHSAPQMNGLFDVDPTQTFVLLIDFKRDEPAIWWKLLEQLAPLQEKDYLTYFNGSEIVRRPITVVVTGSAPFELVTANTTYRPIFYDAPLEEMADLSLQWPNPNRAQDPTLGHEPTSPAMNPQTENQPSTSEDPSIYNPTNSYYASTSFTRSVGRIWGSRLSQEQLQLVRGQIRGAHQRGLKVRYWGLPQWPIGLRNHVWHILMREGVDVLNVDDLRHATERDWRRKKGWVY